MEDEIQNLNGTANNNANDIRVLTDNDVKFDSRLEKIETEASGLAADLADTQTNQDETLNKTVEDLAELKTDLIKTAEKLQAFDEKHLEQEEKIAKIEDSDFQQENKALISQLRSDLDGLELTVVNNTKQIEDGNVVIKRNTEQLIPLLPLAEDVTELTVKVNNLQAEVTNVTGDLRSTDNVQQLTLDDLQRSLNVCKADVEDLEDKQRAQEEKIFGLEEQNVSAMERATYVEQLRDELRAMDEQKQQSEAKQKEEMDRYGHYFFIFFSSVFCNRPPWFDWVKQSCT